MGRIAVIANNKVYSKYLTDNLRLYFGGAADFHSYSTPEIETVEFIEETFIVISAFTIFQKVRKKMREDSRLVIIDLALNKNHVELLRKVPKGTRALLVNIDYRSCMEVITMIYNAGLHDLELTPFYPGMDYDRSINIAITPGEIQLVPKDIASVLDLGQRVVDTNSVIEIADKFGLDSPFASKEGAEAKKNTLTARFGMEKVLGDNESLKGRLDVLLRLVRQGFIITDVFGKIYLANDMAKQMLKSRTDLIEGFNISEILPEIKPVNVQIQDEEQAGELISLNGVNLIVTVTQIVSDGGLKGDIIMIDSFAEAEDRQHKLRSKITGAGHKAVYHFSDILGESESIQEAKKIAKRMAASDSSVVLYGESGTGKELFAQSIHNFSSRRDYMFVAVNCSALPENLLESELYGYEDGAFSGAKKGGKIGLFELAHKGTLFLDEIGELPLALQAKLLRAIEERKILRIGGMDMIDVNVRIITATNRDLLQMVKDKEFRSDLYYRLNVLPVHIPSLRERKEDIPFLFEEFRKKLNADFVLSAAARERMLAHQWEGNVRELKNIAEYLANLGKQCIETEDIPFAEEDAPACESGRNERPPADSGGPGGAAAESVKGLIRSFLSNAGTEKELYRFILFELKKSLQDREHIGRSRLAERAEEQQIFLTEQEIKNGLSRLNACGFVRSGKGRKGSVITESGLLLLDGLEREL